MKNRKPVCLDFEVMESHDGHADCVCTDGYAEFRDTAQTCDSPLDS